MEDVVNDFTKSGPYGNHDHQDTERTEKVFAGNHGFISPIRSFG